MDRIKWKIHLFALFLLLELAGVDGSETNNSDDWKIECDKKQGRDRCDCYKAMSHDKDCDRNDDEDDDDDNNDNAWWIALTVVLSIIAVCLVIALILAWRGYCCCCPRYTKAHSASSYEDNTYTGAASAAAVAANGSQTDVTANSTNIYTIQAPPPYSAEQPSSGWSPHPHYKMNKLEASSSPTARAPSAPPPPYDESNTDLYIAVVE